MSPNLIDIGANLTNKAFRGDAAEVVARAQQRGVAKMIVTGVRVPASWTAYELARAYPGVLYATAGVHPHHARDCNDGTLGELRNLASRPEVLAVGECGLDYNRNFSAPAVQRTWFEKQLQLAVELKMPVFLHDRDAHADFVAILSNYRNELVRGVVHCFTGTQAMAERYLDMDLHIGITGWICDERRGHHLRDVVKIIPADRMMVETDSPYLIPRDMPDKPRSNRNEPAFLPHVLQAVAKAKGCSVQEAATQTTQTAQAFFDLP